MNAPIQTVNTDDGRKITMSPKAFGTFVASLITALLGGGGLIGVAVTGGFNSESRGSEISYSQGEVEKMIQRDREEQVVKSLLSNQGSSINRLFSDQTKIQQDIASIQIDVDGVKQEISNTQVLVEESKETLDHLVRVVEGKQVN